MHTHTSTQSFSICNRSKHLHTYIYKHTRGYADRLYTYCMLKYMYILRYTSYHTYTQEPYLTMKPTGWALLTGWKRWTVWTPALSDVEQQLVHLGHLWHVQRVYSGTWNERSFLIPVTSLVIQLSSAFSSAPSADLLSLSSSSSSSSSKRKSLQTCTEIL